jgi:hypothetical protein
LQALEPPGSNGNPDAYRYFADPAVRRKMMLVIQQVRHRDAHAAHHTKGTLAGKGRSPLPSYARTLGVPVAMANRIGSIDTDSPGGYGEFHSSFAGLSQIVDWHGTARASLGEEEGVLVAAVELGSAHRASKKPRCYEKMWAFPMPWFAFIWPETQLQGEQAYEDNDHRRQRALATSSPEPSAHRCEGGASRFSVSAGAPS